MTKYDSDKAQTIRSAYSRNLAKIAYASYAPERQARLKGSHNPSDALFTRGEIDSLLTEVRDTMLEEIAAEYVGTDQGPKAAA